MLGVAQILSTRIVAKGLLCLRALIVPLLSALVFAGSALASGPGPAVEAAPPAPVTEEAPKAAPPAPVTEQAPKGSLSPLPAAPQGEVPTSLIDSPTGASTVGAPGGTSVTSASGPATVGAPAGSTAARRTGHSSCALSALGGRITDNCAAGWLATEQFLSASPVGFSIAVAALAAATGGAPQLYSLGAPVAADEEGGRGGTHGGSAVGSPPVSPAPGPAPSGASSGSATGASGLGLSGFLTLAALLLLGAPHALRRLRLSCQRWRTACFVLIPERPG